MRGSLSNSPEIQRRHSANVYPEHVGRLTGYLCWANSESTTFSPPRPQFVFLTRTLPHPYTQYHYLEIAFYSSPRIKGHVWDASDKFICACAIIFLPKYTLGHLVTVLLMQPLDGADSRVLKCPGTAKSDDFPLRATTLKIQHHGVSCTFN